MLLQYTSSKKKAKNKGVNFTLVTKQAAETNEQFAVERREDNMAS